MRQRENAELKAGDERSSRAASIFSRGKARSLNQAPNETSRGASSANKDKWGVQPICTVLHFASSTYYDYKRREPSGTRSSEVLITETYEANYRVYGAKKLSGCAQCELVTKWLAAPSGETYA